MFSHIMVGANDIDASKKFYDAVLGALGHAPGTLDPKGRCFYMTPTGIFPFPCPSTASPPRRERRHGWLCCRQPRRG